MPFFGGHKDLLKAAAEKAFSAGGNAFFDVGALGATAVTNPWTWLKGFGNEEAAKEFALKQAQRRAYFPELDVTPASEKIIDAFVDPVKEKAKEGWEWYEEAAPNASESIKDYFLDPRVQHTLQSSIFAAPSLARMGKVRRATKAARKEGEIVARSFNAGMPAKQKGFIVPVEDAINRAHAAGETGLADELRTKMRAGLAAMAAGESPAEILEKSGLQAVPVKGEQRLFWETPRFDAKEGWRIGDDGLVAISDVYDNPLVYRMFPELRRTKMALDPDAEIGEGAFGVQDGQYLMSLGVKDLFDIPDDRLGEAATKMFGAGIHEIGHASQHALGLPRGGNPDMFEKGAFSPLLNFGDTPPEGILQVADRLFGGELPDNLVGDLSGLDPVLQRGRARRALTNLRDMERGVVDPSDSLFNAGVFLDSTTSPFQKYQALWGEAAANADMLRNDLSARNIPYVDEMTKQGGVPNANLLSERYGDTVTTAWERAIDEATRRAPWNAPDSPYVPRGQRGHVTWHASPHKWDRPDLSKIGTGEGVQAFGWGLYSAEHKPTADWYWNNFQQDMPGDFFEYKGEKIHDRPSISKKYNRKEITPEMDALSRFNDEFFMWDDADTAFRANEIRDYLIGNTRDEMDNSLASIRANLEMYKAHKAHEAGQGFPEDNSAFWRKIALDNARHEADTMRHDRQVLDFLQNVDVNDFRYVKGQDPYMYKLNLDDDALATYMNWWDRPKGDMFDVWQDIYKERVRKGVDNLGQAKWGLNSRLFSADEGVRGRNRDYINQLRGHPDQISQALLDRGIHGIRYKAGGFRDNDEAKFNFVSFDERDIDVLERNRRKLGERGRGIPLSQRGSVDFFGGSGNYQNRGSFFDDFKEASSGFFLLPTVAEPRRVYRPGIYKDPKTLATEAEALVAPESPALRDIFGVTRADLAEIGRTRKGNRPGEFFTAANPKGADASKRVMTPENEERLINAMMAAERYAPGLVEGMDGWYVLDPWKDQFVRVLGKDAGLEDYSRWNAMTTMHSPGSPVDWEIPRGSAAYMLDKMGRYQDWIQHGGASAKSRVRGEFPEDIFGVRGHMYHSTAHGKPYRQFVEEGSLFSKEPKVPLYRQASEAPEIGFQTDTAVPDTHFGAAIALPDVRGGKSVGGSLSASEMFDIAPWWRGVAGEVGLESVPAQARTWGLFAPQTGVKTGIGKPKLELIADAIVETALREGVSFEAAMEMIIRGEAYAGR